MYKLTDDPAWVVNLDTQTRIPNWNWMWADYEAWLAAGNTTQPIDPPPPAPVPQSVTRYQARVALLNAGLLDTVNAYFAALPATDLGQLAWNEAPTVLRSNTALEAAAESLGLTSAQVDQLFIAASQVT
jgi:hypothetical protein